MNQKMTFMLLSPTWGRNHEIPNISLTNHDHDRVAESF